MRDLWYASSDGWDSETLWELNDILSDYDLDWDDDCYPQRFCIAEALYFEQ